MTPGASLRTGYDAIGRTQQRAKAQIDQVDAGDAEHQIAVREHPLVQQVVQEIEDRRLRCLQDPRRGEWTIRTYGLARHHHSTNEYAGQGPFIVTAYPERPSERASRATADPNDFAFERGTRKAASSSRRPAPAVSSFAVRRLEMLARAVRRSNSSSTASAARAASFVAMSRSAFLRARNCAPVSPPPPVFRVRASGRAAASATRTPHSCWLAMRFTVAAMRLRSARRCAM